MQQRAGKGSHRIDTWCAALAVVVLAAAAWMLPLTYAGMLGYVLVLVASFRRGLRWALGAAAVVTAVVLWAARRDDTQFGTLAVSVSIYWITAVFLGWGMDIRQKRRRLLQESESKYRALVEQSVEMIFLHHLSGRIADVNEAVVLHTGYSRTELLGMSLLDLLPDSVAAADMAAGWATVNRSRPEDQIKETFLVTKEGCSFPVEIKSGPISLYEADLVLSLVFDITERKRQREELQQKKDELEGYFRCSLDLLTILSANGYFVRLNPEWERVLGYAPEELRGRYWLDLVHPDDRGSTKQVFEELWQTGALNSFENRCRCRDGSYRWVEWRARVDGDRIYAAARDITSRRLAEQQVRDYAEEMELRGLELDAVYRQLDREMESAKGTHRRLLKSEMPAVNGIAFAAHAHPASYIGADVFDAVRKGRQLIVYLSDVTGHGMEGTMLSLFVKNTIDSYIDLADGQGLAPQPILEHLDHRFRREQYHNECAVAIFVMVIDVQARTVRYSAAGFHNPPVLVHDDGRLQFLVSRGLPISPDVPKDAMDFAADEAVLPERAFLFLSSDGLYEQRQGSTLYESRLLQLLKQSAGLPHTTAADRLCQDYRQFLEHNEPSDDITFLVMSTSDTDVAELQVPSRLAYHAQVRQRALAYYDKRSDALFIAEAVHEMASNAMEHGNALDPQASLRLQLTPKAVVIEDQGPGFSWQKRLSRGFRLDPSVERGRGIALVQQLGYSLVYNTQGNRVSVLLEPDVHERRHTG